MNFQKFLESLFLGVGKSAENRYNKAVFTFEEGAEA